MNNNCNELLILPELTMTMNEGKIDEIGDVEGKLTEKHRFNSGMRVLIGLGFIYVFTILCAAWSERYGNALIEICKTTLPPLATLIIAFYFKDKQ